MLVLGNIIFIGLTYIYWLNFNLLVTIIKMANKVFIVSFTKGNLANTFSISTSYDNKIYVFQFQYCQTLKFLYPFLYTKINFLYFIMFCFFSQISVLHQFKASFLLSKNLMFKITISIRLIDTISKSWHLLQIFGWTLKL